MRRPATSPGAAPTPASGARPDTERPTSRDLAILAELWRFVRPYGGKVLGALLALIVAASTVLGLGFGLRRLVAQWAATKDSAAYRDLRDGRLEYVMMRATRPA